MENLEQSRGDGAEIFFVLFGGFKTKNTFHQTTGFTWFHKQILDFFAAKFRGTNARKWTLRTYLDLVICSTFAQSYSLNYLHVQVKKLTYTKTYLAGWMCQYIFSFWFFQV